MNGGRRGPTRTLVAGFAVALFSWFSSTPAFAHDHDGDQSKPSAYDAYILGGGKTRAEAEKVANRVTQKVYALRFAKKVMGARVDTLQVVKSDDIPGLNPGLYIALAGMCRHDRHDSKERETTLIELRKLERGAYSKHIHGVHGDPCPSYWTDSISPDLKERQLRARIEKNPQSADALVKYGEFLADQARLQEADLFAGAALELDPENKAAIALSERMMVLLTD